MQHDIKDEINQMIADSFGVELEDVQPDYLLLEDFNASQLELADLIALMEHTFDITITAEEVRQLETVANLQELLLDKLNEVS